MARFNVVILKHGYPNTTIEQEIVTSAGGQLLDGDHLSEEERWRAAEETDALLVRWERLTPNRIRKMRRCRIIVRYGVGYDNVDYEAATQAGIMIGHAPCYCVEEVATHALALWLACLRNIIPTHRFLAGGRWADQPLAPVHRIQGQTFGIVGLGNIGKAVARRLTGWGLRLLATDPYAEPECAAEVGVELVDLSTLCRESDYLSLHVPLLPETRHMIGRREFELVKQGAILVNTARGPVLDTAALLDALTSGSVRAAGLDVFETEPLPHDSPLRGHPRVVLTNHVAWYSEQSQIELHRTVAEEAVRACTGGLPRNIANAEVLHKLGRFTEWTPTDNAMWQRKRAAKFAA